MECRGDRRIHGDQHVLLLLDGLVPRLDSLANPRDEWLAEDRRADVADPLLRRLPQLALLRQVVEDALVLQEEVEDLAELQVLVERHVHLDDLVERNELLLALDHVLEEVDGHRVHRRQVCLDVHGHEGEDLCEDEVHAADVLTSLAPELGTERGRRDGLVAVFRNLVALHVLKIIIIKDIAVLN